MSMLNCNGSHSGTKLSEQFRRYSLRLEKRFHKTERLRLKQI